MHCQQRGAEAGLDRIVAGFSAAEKVSGGVEGDASEEATSRGAMESGHAVAGCVALGRRLNAAAAAAAVHGGLAQDATPRPP